MSSKLLMVLRLPRLCRGIQSRLGGLKPARFSSVHNMSGLRSSGVSARCVWKKWAVRELAVPVDIATQTVQSFSRKLTIVVVE